MEYILYCDESIQTGPIYSGFFGGCIISTKDWQHVTDTLNAKKTELNFYGEIKWQKVTCNYLNKYIELTNQFFSYVKDGTIKVRIVFQNNNDKSITQNIKPDTKYFKQYYHFIKNAFGLKHLKSVESVFLRIYLDALPYTVKKRVELKRLLFDLPNTNSFKKSPVVIRSGDVAEVDSHEHVILQCLDVILGSMHFRMNDLHLEVSDGSEVIGKRTRSKDKLCEIIISQINEIMPNFDIYETSEEYTDKVPDCYWNHAYRHWRYIPE